ncbi:MAG TPA: nuclear transport factor 2 family protein [Candidatus Methylacidiphilales bacterium]
MKTDALPEPIRIYLDAVASGDEDRFAACFAPDALALDEGREYRGIAAIAAWKREAMAKYRYAMEPLACAVDGDWARLTARVSGTFPGSPVELDYLFTLAGGKIVRLEVA